MKSLSSLTALIALFAVIVGHSYGQENEEFVPPSVTYESLVAEEMKPQAVQEEPTIVTEEELFRPMPESLGRLPVLHNGRVKPLAVAARQSLQAVTGRSNFGMTAIQGKSISVVSKYDAVDVLGSWWRYPAAWRNLPLIEVPQIPLQEHLGLERWATIEQLTNGEPAQYLQQVQSIARHAANTGQQRRDWDKLKDYGLEVADGIPFSQAILLGYAIDLIPLVQNQEQLDWVMSLDHRHLDATINWQAQLKETVLPFYNSERADWRDLAAKRVVETNIWISVRDAALAPDPLILEWPDTLGIKALAREWGQAIQGGNLAQIDAATIALETGLFKLADVEHLQGQGAGEHYPDSFTVSTELLYERSNIFTWTWLAYLLGGILSAIAMARMKSKDAPWSKLLKTGIAVTTLGVLLNVFGFVLRLIISDWGAVTNFYETFIYVAVVVAILGLSLGLLFRNVYYLTFGAIGAALCAMVGEAMPAHLGEDISRLQPVLRSRYWLWVHVKVVTAAYGAFLLAWIMGLYVLGEAAVRGKQVAASAAHALYRCLQIGIVLMVAGTILGAIWADEAWGRYWGWDPKEVWALVIILVYLIPLHLRYIGAVRNTGMAAWSVYGFASVVFSWYGVNFLLGSGLHSYGFGQGGQHIVIPTSIAVILIAIIFQIMIAQKTKKVSMPKPEGNTEG